MDNESTGKSSKKVEGRNFEIRKSLLRFDDVMNEQRKIIYQQRMEIINDIEIDNLIIDMRDGFVDDFFENYKVDFSQLDDKQKKHISDTLKNDLNIELNFEKLKTLQNIQIEDIVNEIKTLSNNNINLKKTEYSEELFSLAQKSLLLQIIDKSWKEHLLSLDHLRQGISLRAYGQKDPLNEYKQEAFLMFEDMMRQIRSTVSKIISFIEIKSDVPEPETHKEIPKHNEELCLENSEKKKIPRNARCPLTGKKYKNCCGKLH